MKRLNQRTQEFNFCRIGILLLSFSGGMLLASHQARASTFVPLLFQDQGTIVFDENFDDCDIVGDLTDIGDYFLPPLDDFSNMVG